jgi:hypothetical protein
MQMWILFYRVSDGYHGLSDTIFKNYVRFLDSIIHWSVFAGYLRSICNTTSISMSHLHYY